MVRAEETEDILASPMIMAAGPLTFLALSDVIGRLTGSDHLDFYDAIAPIITVESIDRQVVFSMSRRVRPAQVDPRASAKRWDRPAHPAPWEQDTSQRVTAAKLNKCAPAGPYDGRGDEPQGQGAFGHSSPF